ncbi:MAG: hypothetical protein ACYSUK_07565 [Planctomycetota bacterium]|jgi:hypothetical protein
MKGKTLLIFTCLLLMTGVAFGDSWTISSNYIKLNPAGTGGHTETFGTGVSYDWMLSPNLTFAVEGIGSWDNDAELYGGGVNLKHHLGTWGELDIYQGLYADYVHARSLPSGHSEEGFIYGPLLGARMPLNESTSLFAQGQYGYIDGATLRRAFDEAVWVVVGLEMAF